MQKMSGAPNENIVQNHLNITLLRPSIKSGTWNIPEDAGTFRNIPEHSGTFRNIPEHAKIKIIFMKKNIIK